MKKSDNDLIYEAYYQSKAEVPSYCGWCGKHLRGPYLGDDIDARDPENITKYRISHGICDDCEEAMFSDEAIDDFIANQNP